LATISQIQIGDQTYNIHDVNAARTTNVNEINTRLGTIESYFNNGVLKYTNGGTQNNVTSQQTLLRSLGLARTAGDNISIGVINAAG
jgi:hypothetical protein